MPTDARAIVKLSQTIATLAENFKDGPVPKKECQDALVRAAEQLAVAARDPDENMYCLAGQVSQPCSLDRVSNTEHFRYSSVTMQPSEASSQWGFLTPSLRTEVL